MNRLGRALAGCGAVGALTLLSACGGGGVRSTPPPPRAPTPTPTPVPTPSPSPSPTPTPTPTPAPAPPVDYDTAEYRATVGAVSMHALTAYDAGATGAHIKVGIVDSGIDLQSQEFGNRIDPASADVAGNRGIDDEGDHGTAVAFTLAGRRNGAGTHGVAFDATLLVMRADSPGSCANTDTEGGPDCNFSDSAIAKGITLAATNGAKVINISLGGTSPSAAVVNAISAATAKGVIVVISAGNDGSDDPDPFAQVANMAAAHNLVIIAGSVGPLVGPGNSSGGAPAYGTPDTLSDFSDKAGNGAAHYLAAVGEGVRAPCDNGENVCIWSGTSLAAPQISGAVALLAQAFPNLTGAQIVSLLFRSARDAGATGVDPVYGNGILDLDRAFQPMGTMSVAGGQSATISLVSNGSLSPPMGDAAQGALGAVVLDGFDRAYAVDLARTISTSGPTRTLTGALRTRDRNYVVDAGRVSVAVTIVPGREETRVERILLTPDEAERARAIAGSVTTRLGSDATFALGFSESGATLEARLAGRNEPAFLVARDPTQAQGFLTDVNGAAALRQQFGAWGLTAAVESGAVMAPVIGDVTLRNRYRRFGYSRMTIAADRRFGPLSASLAGTWLDESDTVLGARFSGGLGGARATSWFVDAAARLTLGSGWTLAGTARQGWTLADVRAGISGSGLIRTNAYSASVGKDGVFGRYDSFGLGVAQPLRVASGGIALHMPAMYDYATRSVTRWTDEYLNLAPTGREIDLEARYAFPLGAGLVQTNLFWRRDPGNFAQLPGDHGMAVRYDLTF